MEKKRTMEKNDLLLNFKCSHGIEFHQNMGHYLDLECFLILGSFNTNLNIQIYIHNENIIIDEKDLNKIINILKLYPNNNVLIQAILYWIDEKLKKIYKDVITVQSNVWKNYVLNIDNLIEFINTSNTSNYNIIMTEYIKMFG